MEYSILRTLAICFRLSIVAAVVVAAIQFPKAYTKMVEMDRGDRKIQTALECAAKVSDERLRQHVSQYGFFEIDKVGCASHQFLASSDEIEKARRGEKLIDFDHIWLVEEAAEATFAAFAIVNLLGLGVVGIWIVARWVIWGQARVVRHETRIEAPEKTS
jgi:hypothetical protein